MKILLPRGCFGLLALGCLIGGVAGLTSGKESGAGYAWLMIACAVIGILRYFYDQGE
jgi:hypothetical protein